MQYRSKCNIENCCTACMLMRSGIVANNGEVVRAEAIAGLGSVLLLQCRLRRTEPSPAERKFHAAACHRQSRVATSKQSEAAPPSAEAPVARNIGTSRPSAPELSIARPFATATTGGLASAAALAHTSA
jgi:hypothetical protein